MGVVHAARDIERGRDIALKRLSSCAFPTPQEHKRATALFEREYHTLSQLTHPHIVEVYEYGIDRDGPYYTMERLAGHSLKSLSPLPWAEASRLVRDAASALAVLHSRRLVHRDVTPANIQLAQDGCAKLIDFGAMVPVGPARQVVGTSPFVAPECLQLQVLDARADIYALGACLYFAIARSHAYPARHFRDLPRVWTKVAPSLTELVPDVPEALDRLVFDMLSLEPAHRPRGIAEVFERLTAIAGLPRVEGTAVAQAYLTNPELVGRDAELEVLRHSMRRAAQGRGCAMLVQGAAGTGRSRLLDAAVVEAKMRGLTAVRASAADARPGALRVVRRLLRSLCDQRPQLSQRIDAAAALFDPDGGALPLDAQARERAAAAFCDCFVAASEQRGLALVVDDFHAIDDPSSACIASLATRIAERRLVLLTSAQSSSAARTSSALALLRESSRLIALEPLNAGQTRAFFASVFGEVPHVELLTEVARRTTGGSPRQLMDGAQALLDRELARYEAGHWLIASDLQALEAALAGATDLDRLLARLSPDAAELLATLALDRDAVMRLEDFPALTTHGDSRRQSRADRAALRTAARAPRRPLRLRARGAARGRGRAHGSASASRTPSQARRTLRGAPAAANLRGLSFRPGRPVRSRGRAARRLRRADRAATGSGHRAQVGHARDARGDHRSAARDVRSGISNGARCRLRDQRDVPRTAGTGRESHPEAA